LKKADEKLDGCLAQLAEFEVVEDGQSIPKIIGEIHPVIQPPNINQIFRKGTCRMNMLGWKYKKIPLPMAA
jgi:hypothetical protein